MSGTCRRPSRARRYCELFFLTSYFPSESCNCGSRVSRRRLVLHCAEQLRCRVFFYPRVCEIVQLCPVTSLMSRYRGAIRNSVHRLNLFGVISGFVGEFHVRVFRDRIARV